MENAFAREYAGLRQLYGESFPVTDLIFSDMKSCLQYAVCKEDRIYLFCHQKICLEKLGGNPEEKSLKRLG